jgi:hypothetical protein
MSEEVSVVLIVLAALVFGLTIGVTANNSMWEQDCNLLGKHRTNDEVYTCYPEK